MSVQSSNPGWWKRGWTVLFYSHLLSIHALSERGPVILLQTVLFLHTLRKRVVEKYTKNILTLFLLKGRKAQKYQIKKKNKLAFCYIST